MAATDEFRERILLFALASIASNGFPSVSGYTCDVYERDGLIERTGDDLMPYRLTAAGMAHLEWAEERDIDTSFPVVSAPTERAR